MQGLTCCWTVLPPCFSPWDNHPGGPWSHATWRALRALKTLEGGLLSHESLLRRDRIGAGGTAIDHPLVTSMRDPWSPSCTSPCPGPQHPHPRTPRILQGSHIRMGCCVRGLSSSCLNQTPLLNWRLFRNACGAGMYSAVVTRADH